MKDFSEKSTWLLFLTGDRNAFSSLFKTYYSPLHNYGIKISANPAITEDCLQSFFVYLFDNRNNIGIVTNLKSYLFISFRRTLLKHLKKERKYSSYDDVFKTTAAFAFSPEDLMVEQEFTQIRIQGLTKLLNNLSTRQREVIYLKYYSDLSIREIAEVMNISYQSVLNTLQKAFAKLRSLIDEHTLRSALKII